MEYLQDASNICLSGGANGADLEWGRCASLQGHKVIHWSFPGHASKAPEDQIVRLSDEQLSLADETLRQAATLLHKNPPKRPNVRSLLQRNYYQVAWSASLYAVSFLEASGGTAWAAAMFRVLNPEGSCYLFCQERGVWFQSVGGEWMEIGEGSVVRPEGVWAGIGARDLRESGRMAIWRVMGYEGDVNFGIDGANG